MLQTTEDKNTRQSVFDQLPDILIQDPVRKSTYFLPANKMDAYTVSDKTWETLSENAVTFVIPSSDMVDEIPPFVPETTITPDVLIQYPSGDTAYFLTFEQLQQFKVDQPAERGGYGISFTIPGGMEMIEELPSLMRSLLQSGERP